ncbi:blue light receptor [Nowakowskiella sp. JEL0407]|nr:blue light receptor [Nowakowskiella sp. JEL0407]
MQEYNVNQNDPNIHHAHRHSMTIVQNDNFTQFPCFWAILSSRYLWFLAIGSSLREYLTHLGVNFDHFLGKSLFGFLRGDEEARLQTEIGVLFVQRTLEEQVFRMGFRPGINSDSVINMDISLNIISEGCILALFHTPTSCVPQFRDFERIPWQREFTESLLRQLIASNMHYRPAVPVNGGVLADIRTNRLFTIFKRNDLLPLLTFPAHRLSELSNDQNLDKLWDFEHSLQTQDFAVFNDLLYNIELDSHQHNQRLCLDKSFIIKHSLRTYPESNRLGDPMQSFVTVDSLVIYYGSLLFVITQKSSEQHTNGQYVRLSAREKVVSGTEIARSSGFPHQQQQQQQGYLPTPSQSSHFTNSSDARSESTPNMMTSQGSFPGVMEGPSTWPRLPKTTGEPQLRNTLALISGPNLVESPTVVEKRPNVFPYSKDTSRRRHNNMWSSEGDIRRDGSGGHGNAWSYNQHQMQYMMSEPQIHGQPHGMYYPNLHEPNHPNNEKFGSLGRNQKTSQGFNSARNDAHPQYQEYQTLNPISNLPSIHYTSGSPYGYEGSYNGQSISQHQGGYQSQQSYGFQTPPHLAQKQSQQSLPAMQMPPPPNPSPRPPPHPSGTKRTTEQSSNDTVDSRVDPSRRNSMSNSTVSHESENLSSVNSVFEKIQVRSTSSSSVGQRASGTINSVSTATTYVAGGGNGNAGNNNSSSPQSGSPTGSGSNGVVTQGGPCPGWGVYCQRTESPEWRRGPDGPKTLCNACGLRYARNQRKKQRYGSGSKKEEVTEDAMNMDQSNDSK